jgi:hypothetical protein
LSCFITEPMAVVFHDRHLRYFTANPRALYLLLNRSQGSKPDHASHG